MISDFLHFRSKVPIRSKVPRRTLLFLPVSSLMIGLLSPQAALSAQANKGEPIYQQKCVACHTIGAGRLVGPDLKGVNAKRDHDWLVRWIVEPDKMLAEGDALAKQISQEYNNIPMPNLGVTNAKAEDILAYIEAKSAGASEPAPESSDEASAASTQSDPSAASTQEKRESALSSEKGVEIYQKICSACHTIGKGNLTGPDLKGVTSRRDPNWLLRWIQMPDQMLAEGDSQAIELMEKHKNFQMPNYALSEAQARDILEHIAVESGEGELFAKAIEKKPASNSTDEANSDPAIGKALYLGQKPFANGGPACITCHRNTEIGGLGGGTLGPDLTKVFSRYGGKRGLTSVLLSIPFPTMQGIFLKQTLEKEEIAHLNAYFESTNSLEEEPVNFLFIVIGIGIGFLGFVMSYILIHLIWRKRLTGVRIPLVGR
jgi:mono/diheme cytochrome c family protein